MPLLALMAILASCSTRRPTSAELDTNYQPGHVYSLREPVYFKGNGYYAFTKIDRGPFWLSDTGPGWIDELPIGTRIKFKQMTWENNFEMGLMISPEGILLDGPHSGTLVSMKHISQMPADGSDNRRMGSYLNPEILSRQPVPLSSKASATGE